MTNEWTTETSQYNTVLTSCKTLANDSGNWTFKNGPRILLYIYIYGITKIIHILAQSSILELFWKYSQLSVSAWESPFSFNSHLRMYTI